MLMSAERVRVLVVDSREDPATDGNKNPDWTFATSTPLHLIVASVGRSIEGQRSGTIKIELCCKKELTRMTFGRDHCRTEAIRLYL
jgi:hypothetical protein